MASTDKLDLRLPDTLPEDFSEWDGEASSRTAPASTVGSKSGQAIGASPNPPGTAEREAILASVLDRARDSHSPSSATVFAKQKQRDFIEWTGEASSVGAPGNSGQSKGAQFSGVAAKQHGQSAEREAVLAPAKDGSREVRPGSSAPDSFKPQKLSTSMVDKSPNQPSPRPEASHKTYEMPMAPNWPSVATADGMRDVPEQESIGSLFQSLTLNAELGVQQEAGKKKWMMIAGVGAVSILLLLLIMIPIFHHGAKPAAKEPAQTSPTATIVTPTQSDTPESSVMKPLTQDKPSGINNTQQTMVNPAAKEEAGVNTEQVRSQMMNDQLSAPSRISQDMKKQGADDAPPPVNFGTAGLGGNGADISVFNGHGEPTVNSASSKPIVVSAGIANGMLVQKTMPIYPLIAKEARVSGTVVMKATISKAGTIRDVQVLNGPAMLRQSAVQAVKTWRYKPYQLNNEPTEVETTINVVFNLGG